MLILFILLLYTYEKPHHSQKDKGKRHRPKLKDGTKIQTWLNHSLTENQIFYSPSSGEQPHSLTVASCRPNEYIIMCIRLLAKMSTMNASSLCHANTRIHSRVLLQTNKQQQHYTNNNTFNPNFVDLVNGSVPPSFER